MVEVLRRERTGGLVHGNDLGGAPVGVERQALDRDTMTLNVKRGIDVRAGMGTQRQRREVDEGAVSHGQHGAALERCIAGPHGQRGFQRPGNVDYGHEWALLKFKGAGADGL